VGLFYSLPLFQLPKYSSLSYLVCSTSISTLSELTNIITYSNGKPESYGLTLDPSKYCFYSLYYNIDNDFESGTACRVLNYLLDKQFLAYFRAVYGQCPKSIASENYKYWASLYMATILDRAMEICYELYIGKHPEDEYHLNIFPCFSLNFFSIYGNKIGVTTEDLLVVDLYGRKRFLENVIEDTSLHSFIDWNFLPVRLDFQKQEENIKYTVLENGESKPLELKRYKLDDSKPPIENFVFYFFPYEKTTKHLTTISPGDFVYIYYVDPIVTKGISEIFSDMVQGLFTSVINVMLLGVTSALGGYIFGKFTSKLLTVLGEEGISVPSIVTSQLFNKAIKPIARVYLSDLSRFIVNVATADVIDQLGFGNTLKYYTSIKNLLALKEETLENNANFMVLVHKTSDILTLGNTQKLTNYQIYRHWLYKGFDCRVEEKNNQLFFSGDKKCVSYFYCSNADKKCYVKKFSGHVEVDNDEVFLAGYILNNDYVGEYNIRHFSNILKNLLNKKEVIMYFFLQ